ncbi:MAG: aspartate 1-decarboxylase [Elusimicrobia bacterium]|nr:aspartate 1-decarboxylase [Elusimicrobiota bacterium]
MFRCMCRSKIKGGRVTDKNIHYEGSITLDTDILNASGILPGEMVYVLNTNSGARVTTYTIEGEKGSGAMCLNGPAARYFEKGDDIIILAVSFVSEEELIKGWKLNITELDENNRVKT